MKHSFSCLLMATALGFPLVGHATDDACATALVITAEAREMARRFDELQIESQVHSVIHDVPSTFAMDAFGLLVEMMKRNPDAPALVELALRERGSSIHLLAAHERFVGNDRMVVKSIAGEPRDHWVFLSGCGPEALRQHRAMYAVDDATANVEKLRGAGVLIVRTKLDLLEANVDVLVADLERGERGVPADQAMGWLIGRIGKYLDDNRDVRPSDVERAFRRKGASIYLVALESRFIPEGMRIVPMIGRFLPTPRHALQVIDTDLAELERLLEYIGTTPAQNEIDLDLSGHAVMTEARGYR